VTEAEDPFESVAHLRGPDEKEAHPVSVGGALGALEVVYIGFNPRRQSPAVWLGRDETLCQVVMFGTAKTAPSNPTADASPTEPSPDLERNRSQDLVRDRIETVDDGKFRVARSLVQDVLEDPRKLLGNVRPVPERDGSKVVGHRLYGIRPDSVLSQLGMQNGDRLESINGYDLSTPQGALLAFANLRDASALSVELTRKGRPTSVHVSVE
jgi:general secretion pathway protein C